MQSRIYVKAGGKGTPIPAREKRTIALLRDQGQTLKVKSRLKAGFGRVKIE